MPNFVVFNWHLIYFVMNNLERIEFLKSYIIEDPSDVFSKYALALEFIKSGSDEKAEHLMRAINVEHPNYLPNYYHFGKLLERTQQLDEAIKIYKKGIAIAKSQNDRHAQNELQNALDELMGDQ